MREVWWVCGVVALPCLGDELTQVRLSRSQRIGHALTLTPCRDHGGQQHV